jgi:type VI secretion system (T6SS) phospholipase Tle1-like effector
LKGLAFGAGLLDNVADAYRYLMETYEDGDRLFLFGFSRGAYTARALGAVLHMYGLLSPGNDGLIPYILRMFAQKSRKAGGIQQTLDVAHEFKRVFSRCCPIHFVGLWDTVSSVGWIYDPVVLPYSACNPSIRIGRHAVSIDERRCFYRQNLWGKPSEGQDIKQVWFSGVHSDVGGSYPERQSGLSQVTLEWMLGEAFDAALGIDLNAAAEVLGWAPPPGGIPPVRPDPAAEMHRSLHGPWWILEFLPHRFFDRKADSSRWTIPLGAYRRIPEGSLISADAEARTPADRLPARRTSVVRREFPPASAKAA